MSFLNRHLDSHKGFRLAIATSVVIVAVDQLTKNWARDTLQGSSISVIGDWLRFTYAENTGIAFSRFTGIGPAIGLIGVAVAGFLFVLITHTTRRVELIALGLILGGALGNLSDRIFRGPGVLDGAVVDWVNWWSIPTFNVADAALNVGVAVLLLAAVFAPSSHE